MSKKKQSKEGAPAGAPKTEAAELVPPLPGEAGLEKFMQLQHLQEVRSRLVSYSGEMGQQHDQRSQDLMVGAACIGLFMEEYGRPEKKGRGRPAKVDKNKVARAFYIRRLVLGESELIAKGWCANKFELSEEGVAYQLSVADQDHVKWWVEMLKRVDVETATAYLADGK